MLDFRDGIFFDSVVLKSNPNNVRQIFDVIAHDVADQTRCNPEQITEKLLQREKTSPSGIGMGVAMPHAQISGLSRPVTMLLKLSSPVRFEGIDDVPVDIVCLLLSPERDGIDHIRRLSRLSRLLRDKKFCAAVRQAGKEEELQRLFLSSRRQLQSAA